MTCIKCAQFSRKLSKKNPICNSCGYFGVIVADFDLNQAQVAASKPVRRRCRDCRKILTPDRYYHCYSCRRPADRPTEDLYDIFSAYERVSSMEPICHSVCMGKEQK